jgi:hypothetical protein
MNRLNEIGLTFEKQIMILIAIAIVIIVMIAGAYANAIYAEAGLSPVYFPKIAPLAEAKPEPIYIQARLSHYWPPWGPPNCSRFVDGYCVSRTSSGEKWEDWTNIGLACPAEYPFWTVFVLPGGEEFTCVDRGGKIVMQNGIPWLDLMVQTAPVPYGTIMTVEVRYGDA